MTLPLSPALRRRMALWLCPELAVSAATTVVAPITAPEFPGKIRPYWWRNEPLRDFLTASHRQLTLEETRAAAVKRFGDGVPSISAIHRYWTRLDKIKAAQRPQFTEFLIQTEANDG